MEEVVKKTHSKKNSAENNAVEEAIEIINEAKKLEEEVIVFVTESKNFFTKLFECCNGRKDVNEK